MQSASAFLCMAKLPDFRWKMLMQQNSRAVLLDSYIFWIFFREGIAVPSFSIAEYVLQILGKVGAFCPSPIRDQPQLGPSE